MRAPRSLQGRLGVWLGVALTGLWIITAGVTALLARGEIEKVFDSALQETAQRILPLAVVDIFNRDEQGVSERLRAIREHDEHFTYIVQDDQDRIVLQSHAADPSVFPDWDGRGFRTTSTHRLYSDDAVRGSIRIIVAEPLAHRAKVARELLIGLSLPLVLILPVTLLAIVLAVRASLAPLRAFRDHLSARGARDLSPIASADLPSEMTPLADTMNSLLSRLDAAFAAERSFAANAAHELRTPLAGAIAQAQRLQSETHDPEAKARAAEIEATLKRLTRLAERLLQLARAEGARLRRDVATDLRPVARILHDQMQRIAADGRIRLSLPDTPFMSDLDPDVFAILFRNLVENALRHGAPDAPVEVRLDPDGTFGVANDGAVLGPEVVARLTDRFERVGPRLDGSGLGLAIVSTIGDRIGSKLVISSPRPDREEGFDVMIALPLGQVDGA
jgi:two-component system, OmpR family, sensor kinase